MMEVLPNERLIGAVIFAAPRRELVGVLRQYVAGSLRPLVSRDAALNRGCRGG
jgi:hypothetical protein